MPAPAPAPAPEPTPREQLFSSSNAPEGWYDVLEDRVTADDHLPDPGFVDLDDSESDELLDPVEEFLVEEVVQEELQQFEEDTEEREESTDTQRLRFSAPPAELDFGSSDEWDSSFYLASISDLADSGTRVRAEAPRVDAQQASAEDAAQATVSIQDATQMQFAIDEMREQIESALRERSADEFEAETVLRVTSAAISAGLLGWFLRAAPMIASAASVLPAWSRFDPMPILMKDRDEVELELDDQGDSRIRRETAAERMLRGQANYDETLRRQDS